MSKCYKAQAITKKARVVPLIWCRDHCIPLWAGFPSLQVVLSFACSVASLSRCPSHYLPCQPQLPEAATADYLFDKGQPIHVVCRTCNSPWHSLDHTPTRGTERHYPSQITNKKQTVQTHASAWRCIAFLQIPHTHMHTHVSCYELHLVTESKNANCSHVNHS